ncbi:hypothetical protein M595_0364 [Lyngbya aestuarii BL J]|uniref:Uncharacterized protein n=1 Tax=Lyngbya aestuarii BL J TaxID=1348334 RepID=U7QTI0_9CYAN|nr:hypothetical protein M595_0364 [Lyngbya aestuarii BL J]
MLIDPIGYKAITVHPPKQIEIALSCFHPEKDTTQKSKVKNILHFVSSG